MTKREARNVIREATSAAFKQRTRGQTMAAVRERFDRPRPYEDHFTGNLERKLACGALRPEIAELVRAELARRNSK